MEVFKAIHDSKSKSSGLALVRRIHQLLDYVNWMLEHIPKEINKEVYQMAKMAFSREEGLLLFADIPVVGLV